MGRGEIGSAGRSGQVRTGQDGVWIGLDGLHRRWAGGQSGCRTAGIQRWDVACCSSAVQAQCHASVQQVLYATLLTLALEVGSASERANE